MTIFHLPHNILCIVYNATQEETEEETKKNNTETETDTIPKSSY